MNTLARVMLPTMRLYAIVSLLAGLVGLVAAAEPVWLTLPPTPKLPGSPAGKYATVNGVNIWYAEFNQPTPGKLPVILLHGGFGNSDYWGDVVNLLMEKGHYIITMDTRGQGRSTSDGTALTYELFARDVVGLLSTLGIEKAAWVGWSDMGTATYAALMDPQHSPWVERAFVFGGSHSYASTNASFTTTQTYIDFSTRAVKEFQALQPDTDVSRAAKAVVDLENTQPNWTKDDFAKIDKANKVTVAGAQYEEAVVLSEAPLLSGWIAGSRLVTLKNVSHFAAIQDPPQFAAALETFLSEERSEI